jgi:hypothetical protein
MAGLQILVKLQPSQPQMLEATKRQKLGEQHFKTGSDF